MTPDEPQNQPQTAVQKVAEADAQALPQMMEQLNQIVMADVRMTDYLFARGFVDRLVARAERMTIYAHAPLLRKELDALMFKGEFTVYDKKVHHHIHWSDLIDYYFKALRMDGAAKMKIKLISGRRVRMTASDVKKIMLDVTRKMEQILGEILIAISRVQQGGAQQSPFTGVTNLGFKETGTQDVDVDLGLEEPQEPEKEIEEDFEVSENDLAKHSAPL